MIILKKVNTVYQNLIIDEPIIELETDKVNLEVPSPINPPEGCAFGHRINAPLYEESKGNDINLFEIEPGHLVADCPCCVDRT